MKRIGLLVGVLLLGGIGAGVLALRSWPMINIVETGRTPEYPDIQPRTYQKPAAEVFDAALHVVNRLPQWSLVGYDEKQGDIQAESRTVLWRFVDDVRVRVRSMKERQWWTFAPLRESAEETSGKMPGASVYFCMNWTGSSPVCPCISLIIHECLLRQPILSSRGAFLLRAPRRTARSGGIKKRPAHEDTARSLSRGRPQT